MTQPGMPSKKFPLIWIMVVLAAAFLLRINALWLPHWRGDQAQYVILAMKLDNFGLDGYNLRRAALGNLDVSPDKSRRIEFTAVKPMPEDVSGTYLAMMKSIGQAYYDEPLHVRAPLLPAILAFSHRWVAGAGEPFAVLSYGFKPSVDAMKHWKIWKLQLWAVLVPLIFNLGIVVLTGFLSWSIFKSRRITVYAAALIGTNPLSVWLAHRILTEDPVTFWITAMFLTLTVSRSNPGVLASACAGLFAGLTVLTNQRAGLAAVAACLFILIVFWQDAREEKMGLKRCRSFIQRCLTHPFFWVFGSIAAAVTAFWFLKVIQVYGEPLHQPTQGISQANSQDITGWFAAVRGRAHPIILFSLGLSFLCPLFALAYLTWDDLGRAIRGERDPAIRGTLMLWVWILVFYLYLADISDFFAVGNKEHRYFYPAYPAIAVLAASGLNRVRQWLADFFGKPGIADATVIFLLLANAAWGCYFAYPKIFSDQLLF